MSKLGDNIDGFEVTLQKQNEERNKKLQEYDSRIKEVSAKIETLIRTIAHPLFKEIIEHAQRHGRDASIISDSENVLGAQPHIALILWRNRASIPQRASGKIPRFCEWKKQPSNFGYFELLQNELELCIECVVDGSSILPLNETKKVEEVDSAYLENALFELYKRAFQK